MSRYKIELDDGYYGRPGVYVIIDRLKLAIPNSVLPDKRYTKAHFETPILALGLLYGKGKVSESDVLETIIRDIG